MVSHDPQSGSKALQVCALYLHTWASVFPSVKWGDCICSVDRQGMKSELGVCQGCVGNQDA